MKANDFKDYLKEDITRIEKVLESIGCHSLWRTGDEVRGASPQSDNHTSVSVNVETLFCSVYKAGEPFRGDILALAQHFREEGFSDTFKFLLSLFGLKRGKIDKSSKRDPLDIFKSIRGKHKVAKSLSDIEVDKFDKGFLDRFVILPHIELFYEGITTQTQEIFNIGYDPNSDRIVFPHFSYDDIDSVVGITGRTLRSEVEMKEFKIPKYYNFIKGYKKMYNLYGFSHSLPYIIRDNMIVIFEAEKSVLKQWSMTRNEGFSASVGGHEISTLQTQIILQNTPSDVEVVIAFDKDVMMMTNDDGEHIGEQYLIDQCRKFSKYRKTSYVYDTYNILGETDSPIDKGVKVWNHLLKYRKSVE